MIMIIIIIITTIITIVIVIVIVIVIIITTIITIVIVIVIVIVIIIIITTIITTITVTVTVIVVVVVVVIVAVIVILLLLLIIIIIIIILMVMVMVMVIVMVMVMVIITTITSIITITRLASSLSLLLCAAVMIRVVSYCCECSALFFFQPSDLASVITIVAILLPWSPLKRLSPLYFPLTCFGAKISLRHFLQWNARCRMPMISSKRASSRSRRIQHSVRSVSKSRYVSVRKRVGSSLWSLRISTSGAQTYHLVAVCRGSSTSKVEWLVEFPVARTGWKRYFTFSTGSSTWTHTRGRGNCKTISVLFCSYFLSTCCKFTGYREQNGTVDFEMTWGKCRGWRWHFWGKLCKVSASACVFAWLQFSSHWIRWAFAV